MSRMGSAYTTSWMPNVIVVALYSMTEAMRRPVGACGGLISAAGARFRYCEQFSTNGHGRPSLFSQTTLALRFLRGALTLPREACRRRGFRGGEYRGKKTVKV